METETVRTDNDPVSTHEEIVEEAPSVQNEVKDVVSQQTAHVKDGEGIRGDTKSRHVLDFRHHSNAYLACFLLFLPILWGVILGIGWSIEDKIEEEVYNIWTRSRSSLANDRDYARKLDRNHLQASSFAAMAVARDGQNLITKERLEEIRLRMEETERTSVSHATNHAISVISSDCTASLRLPYKDSIQGEYLHMG